MTTRTICNLHRDFNSGCNGRRSLEIVELRSSFLCFIGEVTVLTRDAFYKEQEGNTSFISCMSTGIVPKGGIKYKYMLFAPSIRSKSEADAPDPHKVKN